MVITSTRGQIVHVMVIYFLSKITNSNRINISNWRFLLQNGQHRLLPTTDSPTISASTTATNLSSLETLPLTKNNRRMGTLEENLRVAQPEIEPLRNNQKQEFQPCPNNSINRSSSHSISIYKSTTVEGPKLFTQVSLYYDEIFVFKLLILQEGLFLFINILFTRKYVLQFPHFVIVKLKRRLTINLSRI